jgi:radical SAM superfamily enzyme YgiQ (UPF0313 family)
MFDNDDGPVIRPPSEADSVLLQATLGCSHNKCTFCGAYKTRPFRIVDPESVRRELEHAARLRPRARRVFLCDGDALVIPQRRLAPLLRMVREALPRVTRIATYANARSIARKSDQELRELRELGLSLLYTGLESGDDATLAAVNKGVDAATQIEQARRARAAGMKLNVTVLLGLAGPGRSQDHARATGEALSAMDPEQAAALTLMLIPGTPLHADWQAGRFELPDSAGMLAELHAMLRHTELSRGLFMANHASNYLALRVRLPRDKEAALQRIERAMRGEEELRSEGMRGL